MPNSPAMLRPAALCFILGCCVSLSTSSLVPDNGSPLLWAQTFSQVSDLPKQDETVTPNPWNFLHRMTLYRLMIAETDPLMGPMGTTSTDSPLWGLPLQLAWLLNSERLADPTGETTCGVQTGDTMCISPKSWWGCVNYFTSALPFLSAAKQGFMGPGIQVQMQKPAGVEEYCTTYDNCSAVYPDVMTKWDAFFQGLKASADSSLPENEKKDSLLGLFWAGQMASFYASTACSSKQTSYSSEEVSFANSWLNSAEYVSAAHFQSNFANSAPFISPLPRRILKTGDVAPDIADLTPEENQTLKTFAWMKTMNGVLGGNLVSLWKSAMCSVTTREKGRELLQQLMLDFSSVTATFLAILTQMAISC